MAHELMTNDYCRVRVVVNLVFSLPLKHSLRIATAPTPDAPPHARPVDEQSSLQREGQNAITPKTLETFHGPPDSSLDDFEMVYPNLLSREKNASTLMLLDSSATPMPTIKLNL